ncbi:MAG: alpha/beta hydrolase [Pararhodobacter sp.]|nr:alpha/beta hydrolase [Pararhodobacter sp.]
MRDYSWLAEDMHAFIEKTEAAYPPDAAEFTIAEQRAFYDRMCQLFDRPHPPGLSTEDRAIAGVPCRIYTPQGMRPGVSVLYFHGGGFVVGGLHSHDAICAELSAGAQARLIAVDYRLSPEHRHPAAYDDALAVAQAVDGPKVLAGDSAGGNLAAAVAAHLPGIAGQVLIYPGLGGTPDLPSYTRHANAPMLTLADVEFYAGIRFKDAAAQAKALADPTAAPLSASDFAHLPPTALFAAECDPLASDAVEYAARLSEAGVPASLTMEPGMVHGYLRARHMVAGAQASFARITQALAAMVTRAAGAQ